MKLDRKTTWLTLLLPFLGFGMAELAAAPLNIAAVSRATPVDFTEEIYPVLKANCIACHNKTTTKGGLNMETPELMKKGGESGPAIEPGKGETSLLLQTAAHQGDSDMPPKNNKVGAVNLTAEELGLLKLWIDQGAKPGKSAVREIAWKPLPPGLHPIYAVALSPSADLAACSRANQVFVYDLATRKQIAQLDAHRDMSLALAFSPDGSRLASGSYGEVKIWRRDSAGAASGPEARRLMDSMWKIQQLERSVALVALDVSFYASVVKTEDGEIFVLKDRAKKAETAIADAKKKLDDARAAVAPATEGKAAAQKALDEITAELAKQPADKPDAALAAKQADAKTKLEAAAKAEMTTQTAFKTAEKVLASAETELPRVNAKLAETEKTAAATKATQAKVLEAQKKASDDLSAAAKAFAEVAKSLPALLPSPDRRWLIEPQPEGRAAVWTCPGGIKVAEFTSKPGPTTALAWKPDSSLVVPSDGTLANVPAKWTLERTLGTGAAKSPIEDRVNALTFSPDGRTLAVGSGEPSRGGDITLWDIEDGKMVRSIHDRHSDTVLSLDFSPDGKLLASGGADKQLRVTEIASGKMVKVFEGHTHHVMGVTWRADGRVLVSSGADNAAKVWDWVKGERRKNLDGWDKEVTSVRYLGASARLLTTSGDKQVRLIGEDGATPVVLSGTTEFMQAGAASHNGQWVAGGGEDSVLRVWDAKSGAPLAEFGRP